MQISLEGKKALVTGGSRGMGLATATTLAKAGADVTIIARDREVLEAAALDIASSTGRDIEAHCCDVAKAEDIEALNQRMGLGKIDILINNAGGSSRGGFETLTDETWQADLDLKLFAAIRLCRLVLPGMRERRWGRVLNVVSVVGKTPGPNGAPTCVSRAAGLALSKVLAHEYAPFNVTVNALCTGHIRSEQWHTFHQREAPDMEFEEFLSEKGKAIPMGRLGEAQEMANVICFLASDAGSYVTGAAINVDGGKCAVM
jgi:3-oxoacyl-[acyl-carrier protein] reductase